MKENGLECYLVVSLLMFIFKKWLIGLFLSYLEIVISGTNYFVFETYMRAHMCIHVHMH